MTSIDKKPVEGVSAAEVDLQAKSKKPSTIASSEEPCEVTEAKSGSDQRQDDEGPKYPEGLKLVTIVAALCLAVFLVALDQTIISTAIPKITDQFHSIDDIGW